MCCAISDADAWCAAIRTQTQAKFDALYTPNVLPLAETDVRRRVYTQNEVDRIRDELQHDIDENRIDIARNMRMIQLEQMSVDVAWLVTCGMFAYPRGGHIRVCRMRRV